MTEDYYWDQYNATTGGLYLDYQERSIIDTFLDCYTPILCLDIACGSGRFSLPIMDRGVCVVAGDRDPVPIRKLNNKLLKLSNQKKSIFISQIDAEHLPFRDKIFDCILSLQTVGYLDLQCFLSECNRILQNRGWLLFNEANNHSYKAAIHRNIGSSSQFYRHNYAEVCSILINNGFQVKEAVGMNWLPIKRDSDSRWIPLASKMEEKLRLSAIPSISPWVFYIVQKMKHTAEPMSNHYGAS